VIFSREYQQFRSEFLPAHFSWYEKLCNLSEKILKISPDPKREKELWVSIETCHLNTTPTGTTSFSILAPMIIAIFGSLIGFVLTGGMFFVIISFFMAAMLLKPLKNLPDTLANSWRLKSSNQMVLCVFYVVTFMRHTSNLELAIEFASEHIGPPLSLDLKKVLWNVETEKYESIKESLDHYLEGWKKWNMEFIESFHLIESSLYEGAEERRLAMLDKSLDVILEETYEKMLHYAQGLKSPITMLHMMGIILPVLGMVILPLIVSFMSSVRWFHIATLYNVLLPLGIYYMGKSILSKRPTGYGDSDISETNPELKKYKNVLINLGGGIELKINPIWISILFAFIFLLIGFSPLILNAMGFPDIGFGGESDISSCGSQYCFLGYRESSAEEGPLAGKIIGPFGMGASVLSLFVTLGVGLSIGIYYKLRSRNVMAIRDKTKKLENEFASALFQLGNRLGDGLPAEIAFSKVATTMEGSISGDFFTMVSTNVRKLGLSVQDAIFNPKTGALIYFPSNLIESSMKVLVESVKKGPKIAAQALTNISRYIKEIHKVNERLKDLLAEIISSMKSQIKFLAPAISGIVVGITAMITSIIGNLGPLLKKATEGGGEGGAGMSNMSDLFGDGIPTYHFQIVIGLYVIEMIYIMTIITNGIENGSDKLSERYNLGKNMMKSVIMYSIISLIVMVVFNLVAGSIMNSIGD
jgi:hypothetical protein